MSFSMQSRCLAHPISIKLKKPYALSAMKLTTLNTGLLPIATICRSNKLPPHISSAGTLKIFFAWWKRHLKVYHLIARSKHGLMAQILSGLITYLLLAIYCHEKYNEKVSIKRVRQLRIVIQNQLRCVGSDYQMYLDSKNQKNIASYAKT